MPPPSLEFTRSGTHLAVRSSTGIYIVDIVGGGATVDVGLAAADEILAVGDQFWVVAGEELHRIAIGGAAVGPRVALSPGPGRLRRTAGRDVAAAAWTGSTGASVLVAGPGGVATHEVPGDPDCVIPVSPVRWLVCQRERVTLREATSIRWTAPIGSRNDRVIDGAILFDGRSVALVVASADQRQARQLVVLGLHEPIMQHRLTLGGVDDVRFAPLRGFALLRAGTRLLLLDLRFGRVLKEHETGRDLADLAIDDAAQHVALRFGDSSEVIHFDLLSLLALPTNPARADSDAPGDPLIEPASAPREEAAAEVAFDRTHAPLGAMPTLVPRPVVDATPREASFAILERCRTLVSALAGRAIANAWDQGKLTFPNEGGLPFRAEVTGLLGRTAGRAPDDVAAGEHAVSQALAALRAAEIANSPRVHPLEALAREFELSTIARLILLVVAGPALWGELARLYAILANDPHRPLCDELLVHQLLGAQVNRHDIAKELDRGAPLLRHGLVRAGEGRMRPFVTLNVEPSVLRLLRGEEAGADVEDVRVVTAERAFEQLLIPAHVKDRIAIELAAPHGGPARLVVRGRTGSGRHALLATLAQAVRRRLAVIDATPMVRELRTRAEQLRLALRRAHLLGMLPCIDGLEAIGSEDQVARDTIRDMLRVHPGPLAVRLPWDARPPLDPGHILIDLPALSIQQRVACWREMLANASLDVRDPAELAIRYSVGPGVVARVCAQVQTMLADARDRPSETLDVATALDEAVRQNLETRLTATATRVTRLATWAKVVLPPDTLDSLLELIARIKHRRIVYEDWGFDSVMSTSRGVTALFQGGPGTGKTLVASAIASELGMDLYRVDVSRIMSKWIGETEQNLAKLFDAAEDGHAIILFDEADSLFAKRTEVRTSVDRYANVEVNYLLQRFDTFEGIAILTTNFGTSIDSAFKRRLSFRLTFPFPDEEMREKLWKAHLPKDVPRAGVFDFGVLARRYRLSGGYIRNAALRAAFRAAEEHVPLTQDHLERAIKAEFHEIGKLADSGVLE